jgi:hypothetical protein
VPHRAEVSKMLPVRRQGLGRQLKLAQALQRLGWIEGGNVRTETRRAADDPDRYRGLHL